MQTGKVKRIIPSSIAKWEIDDTQDDEISPYCLLNSRISDPMIQVTFSDFLDPETEGLLKFLSKNHENQIIGNKDCNGNNS